MSNYTKERNILTFDLDGVNGVYKFDLSNGQFYGLRGIPVKTCPKASAIRSMLYGYRGECHNLVDVLRDMFYETRTARYPHYLSSLRGAERIDALGVTATFYNDEYSYIDEHFDLFNKYIKAHNDAREGRFPYSDFRNYVSFEKAKKKLGGLAEQLTPEQYRRMSDCIDLSLEEWTVALYYLNRGKYWEYTNGDCVKLARYFNLCRTMEKQPQKENNFMREYVETMKEYELRKKEFDKKRFENNYKMHEKAFQFTFGEYSVVLPTCGEDIIKEGRDMHHCVGSYVDRVIENSTYIIFIRKTETPDQCYLTCQVSTDGEIGQYYLAYDRRISSAEDIAFREALQKHLTENW